MSIWTDIHKRSNGASIRKEDRVIPEENFQDNAYRTKWDYDSRSEIFTSSEFDLLDNFKDDYNCFGF